MNKVLVDRELLEEAAKWLEVHSPSSGSAEAFAAEALREALAQPAEAGGVVVLARGYFHSLPDDNDYEFWDEKQGVGQDCDGCVPAVIVSPHGGCSTGILKEASVRYSNTSQPAEAEGAIETGSDAWMALHLLDRLDVSADEELRVQQVEEIVRRMGAALSAVTVERDRLREDAASLRGSCKALGEENKQLKRENKRQSRTIAAMAAKEA